MNRLHVKVAPATDALLSGLIGQVIRGIRLPKGEAEAARARSPEGHGSVHGVAPCVLVAGSQTLYLNSESRDFENHEEEFLFTAGESMDMSIRPGGPPRVWEDWPWPRVEGQTIDRIAITTSIWSADHSAEDGILIRLRSGMELRIVASEFPATLDLDLCEPDSPVSMKRRKVLRTLSAIA